MAVTRTNAILINVRGRRFLIFIWFKKVDSSFPHGNRSAGGRGQRVTSARLKVHDRCLPQTPYSQLGQDHGRRASTARNRELPRRSAQRVVSTQNGAAAHAVVHRGCSRQSRGRRHSKDRRTSTSNTSWSRRKCYYRLRRCRRCCWSWSRRGRRRSRGIKSLVGVLICDP